MPFWSHVRLAGSVMCIAAAFMNNIALTFLGLLIIAAGTINGVSSLERRVQELETKEEDKD